MMGIGRAAGVALGAALLAGCCSPNRCPQAKTGAQVLDSAIAKVEQYKERNGRYPVVLDDIEKGLGAQVQKELRHFCPDCMDFKYRTDPFGFEMEYSFYQGGRNTCRFNSEAVSWSCRGEY